jgi:3-hydroxymyristoyl/3-hydroxydecanoyl-(acyl carrier protein) dehydratase
MQDSLLKRFIREPAQLSERISGDFPRVIAIDDDGGQVTLQLDVTPDLSWFRGHFPGEPVLAGIIQTHWAVQAASALFGLEGTPQHIKRLKFSNIIVPPRVIELMLTRHGEHEVQFQIQGKGLQHSQGRLIFPEPRQ